MDTADIRREYDWGDLNREDLDPDPIRQFDLWFAQARDSALLDPTAMSLATSDLQGHVTNRTVLLKIYDQQGFVFFTNYESTKAKQMDENPNVALLFSWLHQERQIEITGSASRISSKESLKYFLTRPRGSQLGAWVSPQSQVISSREMLQTKLDEIKQRFASGDISLPEFWGGYRVRPQTVEFWQGRPNRLHDRFEYRRQADDSWEINRLAP
ncbi:MAG: pyridoxamine 5'-phosphate oxidase [Gammaproteobacteria bacterium]|nr:pyridoxamine 5'-phosphate oxidase [Gammaproteobacteria bacterium]